MMMPSVEIEEGRGSLKKKRFVPLWEEWEIFQKTINGKETPALKKHIEEIFGASTFRSPDLFNDIQLGTVEGIPLYHEFQDLPVREQAKYLAYTKISSMTKIMERHYELLARNHQQMIDKLKKNS